MLCKRLKEIGVDLVDCSVSNIAQQRSSSGPATGCRSPGQSRRRRSPTAAVGLISEAVQAEQIVSLGQADAVCLARAFLRDPYWPRHAAKALGVEIPWPDPYKRCDVGPLGR